MLIPATVPLLPRQELFAHHVAYGASLAQAARLAGYSPHGARQRGSLLMANSDIRIRVEKLRRSWLADREKHIGEAVAEVAQVIDKALRLDLPPGRDPAPTPTPIATRLASDLRRIAQVP